MYQIGLINKGSQPTFIERFGNSVIINDDDVKTIESSDVVFYFDDTKLSPNNSFDTKNLHDLVEVWGYCFENEIPVNGKTFVICCDVNKGEVQKIHEILNPMNIDIVYLPPTKNVVHGKIVLGTLNHLVLSKMTSILMNMNIGNLSITDMSFSSAELTNLIESNFDYLKFTFYKMIGEICENKDEVNLITKFMNLENINENLDMKIKNEVFSSVVTNNGSPINFPSDINHNLQNDLIYNLNQVLDENPDLSIPLVVDGLTYSNDPKNTDNRKIYGVLQLLKSGYTLHILETQEFLRNKALILEFTHDYNGKVKFYKKGSDVDGKHIML